jgi:hypothetical protein
MWVVNGLSEEERKHCKGNALEDEESVRRSFKFY